MVKKRSNAKAPLKNKPKNASPENYFILVTGVPVKNLKELANSFESMNDWVFNHHVNESRNDFAAWMHDILSEEELAQEISLIKEMKDMEHRILKHMVNKYL
ncbi:MAG: DUF5752 family protein [archaeon]